MKLLKIKALLKFYIFTIEGRNMVDFTRFLINSKKFSRPELFQHFDKNRKFDIIAIFIFI